MESYLIIIGVALVAVLSFVLGERGAMNLPRLSAKIDRKPFNCRPCLTFWIQALGVALIALIAKDWIIALSGVITALITFVIVWCVERKKVLE